MPTEPVHEPGLGPLRRVPGGLLLGDAGRTAALLTTDGLVVVREHTPQPVLTWRRFRYFGLHLPTQPALPGRPSWFGAAVRRYVADGSAMTMRPLAHDALIGRLVRPKTELEEPLYGVPALGFHECQRLTGFAERAVHADRGDLLADAEFWREALATGRSSRLPADA